MSDADDFAAPSRKRRHVQERARQPGEVIAGRYRIVRVLAAGGMGQVYEADDQELHERVALKTILPELADDRRHIERFKREMQLARRITHPSVCRVFELGHDNDVWFLTMELLDGETLAHRLRGEPMSTAEALPIVRQLALGLGATHAVGIIHRDFKPENVVLCRDGRAVITDFGIARGHETIDRFKESVTLSGEFIGSPSYMAPEQVEGEDITARADTYALGVVMYEMVTGRLPFHGATDFATAAKRLTQKPAPPSTHVPGLDPRWERAILRCLERDPARRFSRAEDVAAALVGKLAPQGRPLLVAGAFAAVGAAAVAGWLALHGRHGAPAKPPVVSGTRPSIAVIVRDRHDGPSLAAAEALDAQLSAGERLRVIPAERIATVLAENPQDVGAAVGAQLVVTCSASGGVIQIHVAREGDAFDLHGADIAQLAEQLREHIGIAPLTAAELHAARAALVEPPAAAEHYAVGLESLRRGDAQAAGSELAKAAELAPNAPLVHLALSRAWSTLGYEAQALDEADRAVAHDGELSRTDKLVIDATRAGAAGNWVRSAELYGALWTFFPDDLQWGLALADAQSHAGRNQDLEATLAQMRKMPPPAGDDPRIDLAEADLAENLGNFTRERDACERAAAKSQSPGRHELLARAKSFEGWAMFQLGDPDKAIADYTASLTMNRELGNEITVAGEMTNIANVRRRQGKTDEAAKLYTDALAIYDRYGAKSKMWVALNGMAIMLADRGDLEGAQHAFERAQLVTHETGDKVGEATASVNIGMLALMRGKLDTAKAEALTAVDIAHDLGDKRMAGMAEHALGAIFDELGDRAEARRRYELALEARAQGGDVAGQDSTRAALAQLDVDDGKPQQAIEPARTCAQDLEKQDLPDEAAAAYSTLASAQLAAGNLDDAKFAGDRALALANQGSDKPTHLGVDLVRARIANDAKAADDVASRATELGLTGIALQARIAAARLRKDRHALAKSGADARAAGFEALARDAERR